MHISSNKKFRFSSSVKTTVKVQILGRMASIGISDVVTVNSEKTHLKKLMMMTKMIIISILNSG